MSPLFDHERPILLVLRDGADPAEGFLALLEHPEVVSHHLPAPWAQEAAGLDLLGALPRLETVDRTTLSQVLGTLRRLATPAVLDGLVRRLWREVDERVRGFYLERGTFGALAASVGLTPRTREMDPPPSFVADRVHEHGFVMEYRLHRDGDASDPRAPAEEGSLVFYPFDPANRAAREEAGIGEGTAVVLEAFAYASARERHRRILEDVAHGRGWRVLDGSA